KAQTRRRQTRRQERMMDSFLDEAAKILASSMPRRRALKRIGWSLVTGIFVAWSSTPAEAACTPACKKNEQCCGGTSCQPVSNVCCGTTSCAHNQTCVSGRCQTDHA